MGLGIMNQETYSDENTGPQGPGGPPGEKGIGFNIFFINYHYNT